MIFDPRQTWLSGLELLAGLAPDVLAEVAEASERLVFRQGDTLIDPDGPPPDGAILIVDGEVRTLVPGEGAQAERDEDAGPGALIAEMAMVVETSYSTRFVAVSPVRALKLPREALMRIMARRPELADHLTERIRLRLRAMARELKSIDDRLAATGGLSEAAAGSMH